MHDVFVAHNRCHVQRCLAVAILGIDIRIVGEQQFHHLFVTILRCQIQRCLAVISLGIDIGLVRHQQLCHIFVSADGRIVQRRPAKVVFAGN